jgi:hypothetical protein
MVLLLMLIAPSSCKQPEPAARIIAYEIRVTSEPPGLHFHGNYSVWQPDGRRSSHAVEDAAPKTYYAQGVGVEGELLKDQAQDGVLRVEIVGEDTNLQAHEASAEQAGVKFHFAPDETE